MRIEWDQKKDRYNRRKHRLSSSQAAGIFLDSLMVTVVDARPATYEERLFSIGRTRTGQLLSVGHSDEEAVIRIITARGSSANERLQYEEGD